MEREAIQHLLFAINILAPTGKDQRAAAKLVNDLRRDGETDKNVCRALSSFLVDGLAYGNWPSAVEAMQQRV